MAANTVALAGALNPDDGFDLLPFQNPHHWRMNESKQFINYNLRLRRGLSSNYKLTPFGPPGDLAIPSLPLNIPAAGESLADSPQYGMTLGEIKNAIEFEGEQLGIYSPRSVVPHDQEHYPNPEQSEADSLLPTPPIGSFTYGFNPDNADTPYAEEINYPFVFADYGWYSDPTLTTYTSPIHPGDKTPDDDSFFGVYGNVLSPNSMSLFKYMSGSDGILHNADYNGSSWSLDPNLSNAIDMDDLFLLANNMSWCYHNVATFEAMTDVLSGYVQYTDRQWDNDPDRPVATGGDGFHSNTTSRYIPGFVDNSSESSMIMLGIKSLVLNYDTIPEDSDKLVLTTTGEKTLNSLGYSNADSIVFASLNAISVFAISNSCPFWANSTATLHTGYGGENPSMNTIAMWLYSANGSVGDAPVSYTAVATRPAGLGATHPAASMTVKEVYNYFLGAVNNYTYFVRSFIEADTTPYGGFAGSSKMPSMYPAAGDYDPNPGVVPANTFIYGGGGTMQQALARRTQRLSVVDLMSRTTLPGLPGPGETPTALQNAIANTSPELLDC